MWKSVVCCVYTLRLLHLFIAYMQRQSLTETKSPIRQRHQQRGDLVGKQRNEIRIKSWKARSTNDESWGFAPSFFDCVIVYFPLSFACILNKMSTKRMAEKIACCRPTARSINNDESGHWTYAARYSIQYK